MRSIDRRENATCRACQTNATVSNVRLSDIARSGSAHRHVFRYISVAAVARSSPQPPIPSPTWQKQPTKTPASTWTSIAESMARLPRLLRRTHSPRVLPAEGGFAGLFQLDFPDGLFARQVPGSGARLRHRRRRHEAEGRPAGRRAQHGRHRPGGDVRERRALLRGRAAVLSRLRGDGERRSAAAGGDRHGHQRRLRGERHGARRRRDGDHARHVPAAAITTWPAFASASSSGRKCSTARRSRPATSCSASPRAACTRTATAWCGRSCSRSPGSMWATSSNRCGATVGDVLLQADDDLRPRGPQRAQHYKVKSVVHGIAHITGGGLHENLARILPPGVGVTIDRGSWPVPPVFTWLQQLGDVDDAEMYPRVQHGRRPGARREPVLRREHPAATRRMWPRELADWAGGRGKARSGLVLSGARIGNVGKFVVFSYLDRQRARRYGKLPYISADMCLNLRFW